jgi:type II secretion system protein J
MSVKRKYPGFTLVELLLATVIGAFIAAVAVAALRTVSASAEMVDQNVRAAAEVRFAANLIARDLMNFYRDDENEKMRLIGGTRESGEGMVSWLVLYSVVRAKARLDQPESDVYEVEYSLEKEKGKSILYRRVWPNPDIEAEPGGLVSVIAEEIEHFGVRFFDGQEWQFEWPEEMRSIPELVEVTIAARQPEKATALVETLVVNFARANWSEQQQGQGEQEGEGR